MPATANTELQNAIALHQRGQLSDAEPIYRKILQASPDHFDGQHLLGVLKHQQGRNDEAATLIGAALKQRPNEAVALTNYGAVLNVLGRFAETVACCDRALAQKPDYPEAHNNRGVALKALKHTEAALASYDTAIALRPTYAEAFNNRGIVLRELNRLPEAIASYDQAIALKPTYAEAYNNRGVVLTELKRLDAALVNFATAITLKRDYAEAYNNSGAALYLLKRHDEARACYDKAIAFNSAYADAHWNRAQLTLLQGDFARGWAEHEWRWKIAGAATRDFGQPQWRGDTEIAGKTILLHSEQGLGDTIQFCRYAPLVAERGARVILEVQKPLERLMSGLPGVTEIIAKGAPRPAFDFHCPLLSLPLAFGTRLETIPPSCLTVPAAPPIDGTERTEPNLRPKIGLVWSGNPTHKRDRDRSIALRAMLPLLEVDATFVSLQKEVRASDESVLKETSDILDLRDRLGDFADTAAVISQLDLVISVDTSVAHLTGALGKPVWMLLNDVPDWRWLLNRDDSPWYPTARLFRQDSTCDWNHVIARVRDALRDFVAARR